VCVSSDGNLVWAFGDGDYGKLGLGNTATKSTPQVIKLDIKLHKLTQLIVHLN
jgi:alpha-tubulin suppressor-like RCC1 family protein